MSVGLTSPVLLGLLSQSVVLALLLKPRLQLGPKTQAKILSRRFQKLFYHHKIHLIHGRLPQQWLDQVPASGEERGRAQ